METPVAARELRPLGIGEVLDRAVTLCVRFFVPLALVYVVFAVPEGITQFFAGRSITRLLEILSASATQQRATGRPPDPTLLLHQLARSSAPGGAVFFSSLLVFLFAPFVFAALTEMTAADYLGRPSSFAAAYRVALRRWLPLIGVNLIFAVIAIVAYVAVSIFFIVLAIGVASVYVYAHPLGLVLGIPLAIVTLVLTLGVAMVGALALQVSYFTCVLERAPPLRALLTSFSRVFSGVGLPRALVFGAAYLAIIIGVGLAAVTGEAALAGLLHSDVAANVYATILRLVSAVFTTAFVCVFYFDLRVREEGYDLQLAAQEVLR